MIRRPIPLLLHTRPVTGNGVARMSMPSTGRAIVPDIASPFALSTNVDAEVCVDISRFTLIDT